MRWTAVCGLVLWLASAIANASAQSSGHEVADLVHEGQVEALRARLTREDLPDYTRSSLLGAAMAQRAARQTIATARESILADAERMLRTALDQVAATPDLPNERRDVLLAQGRYDVGVLLLGQSAAPLLDEFVISNGLRSDRAALLSRLDAARAEFQDAYQMIQRLADRLPRDEELFLTHGVFDAVQRLRVDVPFQLGWVNSFRALVETDPVRSAQAARSAVEHLSTLLQGGLPRTAQGMCHLGLAQAQRALGLVDEAERAARQAFELLTEPPVSARAKVELARVLVTKGEFETARAILQPLARQPNVGPDAQAAEFYFNVARVLLAESYLTQARKRGNSPEAGSVHAWLDEGLAAFDELAARGGPWPSLVNTYVQAHLSGRRGEQLSDWELLWSARLKADQRQLSEAIRILETAAARIGPRSSKVGGEVRFELARCYAMQDDRPRAAHAFADFARLDPAHPRAVEAASNAIRLSIEVAERSGQPADYEALVSTLDGLVQKFAEHPDRDLAEWWSALALQKAGRHAEAAERFGKIPASSPYRDEARLAGLECQRRLLESTRQQLPEILYRAKLKQHADSIAAEALAMRARAGGGDKRAALAAEALVRAAELLASDDVRQPQEAIEQLDLIESSELLDSLGGRVLAVRIRALTALGRHDEAAPLLKRFSRTAEPDAVGGVLAAVASGMQAAAEQLAKSGDAAEARRMASTTAEILERLLEWVRADSSRQEYEMGVLLSLAQSHLLAGNVERARDLAMLLVHREPRSGAYRRLEAITTTRLADERANTTDGIDLRRSAKAAWGRLLQDPDLRQTAPEHYWEARYQWLRLHRLEGHFDEVRAAIRQERIWAPDLGGEPWRTRFEELER